MTNPTSFDPICPGHIMVPNDSLETSEYRTTIPHDEHIARLTQEIEDLRSELTRVENDTLLGFDASAMTTQEQALIDVTATTAYMPLHNTETPTISGAEPEETLKNWTYTSSWFAGSLGRLNK
ncbi:hypothetical protein H5410_050801 [Solanum commersonii]|uniref:Uncharacterized protein n=1 Tax=Solanum commersonii TaxID=4109 RepID=A0A9J5WYX1_SOLCO|nr:hypothetical protein H5410_050801 [Solanum commersonii]